MNRVFLGIPTYDGRVGSGVLQGFILASKEGAISTLKVESFSILTRCFNRLYSQALNLKKSGITHFCMLHEDVAPESFWLDTMLRLMDEKAADVLSVVIPIKSKEGFTSTALDESVNSDPKLSDWFLKRLTLEEVYNEHEPTFTHPKLLVNTGCMLVDIRKEWAENVWFEFGDRIIKTEAGFIDVGLPEDWNFSRMAREKGASIWATREVRVEHIGRHRFPNDNVWGTVKKEGVGV